MKVYSPSSTKTWTRCPMMRALNKEGWVPRYMAKKDWSALIGKGFAAGVGIYNNLRAEWERAGAQAPERDPIKRADLIAACSDAAVKIIEQELADTAAAGIGMSSDDDEASRSRLEPRIRKAVSSYIATDPIPDSWRIVDVEKDFGPEYGNARADLVVMDDLNALAMLDYKSKLTLKAEYRAKTVQEYANSPQMFHYSWAGQSVYQKQVARYFIGLAVLEPRWAFDLLPFPVHPESVGVWLQSAQTIWRDMEDEEAGRRVPWLSSDHSDQFGQCPYYKACFNHHYDPALMVQDYVKLPV